MKTFILGIFMAGALALGSSAARAAAVVVGVPGTLCKASGAMSTAVNRTWGGAGNSLASSALYMVCPINSSGPAGARVFLTIGSSGASQTVPCIFAAYTASRTGWWSATRYLCAADTGNGCASSTVAGAGTTGSIRLTNPVPLANQASVVNTQIECNLPPSSSADALITKVIEFSNL